jgi:hypothetical protein
MPTSVFNSHASGGGSYASAPSVPSDCASDGGSYSSTLPDYTDVSMDDSELLATNPWVATDDFTSDIPIDSDPIAVIPTGYQTNMEIGILPRLGTCTLIETEQPILLFEDQDVRPDWLLGAVKDFFWYTPYLGRFSAVVDQFLAQEARLGYPDKVLSLFLLATCVLTTSSL